MSDAAALATIGWQPGQPLPALSGDQRLVRVIEQHRNGFVVHDGVAPARAEAPRGLVAGSDGTPVRPAVGDFVIAAGQSEPLALLALLPRRSVLRRGAAGERYRQQVLAANVDLAVVVMGLDGDYNPRRLERYLALVGAAGIETVVVLTKADRHEDAAQRCAALAALSAPVPVWAVNAKDPQALAPLAARLGSGRTGVLLGSSGAGKSTLSNSLMGTVRQKTGDVRAHDSRGRHTTTVRSLLQLPTGGCLIDSPGMRELKFTGDEAVEVECFGEIDALVDQCRFRDCRHEGEPGCAVQAALADGRLDPGRLAHFRKLSGERDAAAAQRDELERRTGEGGPGRAAGRRATDRPTRR